MGINHEGAHARVFRGLDGDRRVHMLGKRDVDYNDNLHRFIHVPTHNTNHGNIKMNIPEGYSTSVSSSSSAAAPTPTRVLDKDYHKNVKWNVPEGYQAPEPTLSLANKQQADAEDVDTVYSVVYKTMSASFTGSPAGYVTESSQASPTNVAQAGADTSASPAATNTPSSDESAYESAKAAAQAVPSSSPASTSDSPVPTRQVIPVQHSSAAAATTAAATTGYVGAAIQNTPAPSAVKGVPLQSEASHNGMSGGAKAGLAIGIIAALALVAGLVFFCMRRRKNQNRGGEEIDEKSYNEKSGFAATTAAKRLSADSDKSSVRSSNTPTTAPRLSLRPVTQFLPNLTSSNNQAAHKKPSTWERRPQAAQNPFGDAAVLSEKQANPFEEGDGTAAHERSNSNGSASGSEEPPTPKSAKFGTAAAVPVAKGPNNVHRVQLDFKPSMEDELELTSGQLVRMLHEYDDGWVSLDPLLEFLRQHPLTFHPRLSAPVWTAPSRVLFPVPVSPSSPSSLVALLKVVVLRAQVSARHHQAPTLLVRSPRPASSPLASLRTLLPESPCLARLSKLV